MRQEVSFSQRPQGVIKSLQIRTVMVVHHHLAVGCMGLAYQAAGVIQLVCHIAVKIYACHANLKFKAIIRFFGLRSNCLPCRFRCFGRCCCWWWRRCRLSSSVTVIFGQLAGGRVASFAQGIFPVIHAIATEFDIRNHQQWQLQIATDLLHFFLVCCRVHGFFGKWYAQAFKQAATIIAWRAAIG